MLDTLYIPFFEATCNVFFLMLDLTEITNQPIANNDAFKDGLAISIGVIGDLKGEVIYHFPQETSLAMVNIMSGMEMDAVDEFVTSAISEIANIISGNVLTMLAEKNLKCDILPPKPYVADDSAEFAYNTSSCLSTAVGDVCLDIHLNPAR